MDTNTVICKKTRVSPASEVELNRPANDRDELGKRIDKLTFAILMILNHIREGKEIDGNKIVLTVPKNLAQQIEAILTK